MAAEGLYFPDLHLGYTPPVEETPKECSVRGCRRFVDPNAQTKMCEECRGRHRVYATTKRMRRKMEKAALQVSMGGEGLQASDWNHNPGVSPEATIPSWDPTIDPMLYEVSTGTATPPAPMQSQLTLASSSSELANALSFPAQYYQEDASVQPPQRGPSEDACISPAMLQGTEDSPPTPSEDPAEGNSSDDGPPRYCSVKGCKAVIPGSYEYKMCPSCRTRYRGYGITKRKKWKAERQAFEHEMVELRRAEDERRKANGLPLLADSPEELRAWELSVLDEQIALPPQVIAALGEADGEGGSTSAAAPSILSLYQNDPTQTSDVDSPHAIAPYATVIGNTPQLPARMCTVSHCHQILPGYYRFKRCEQHRLQNRHHSKLKRVREKEEKAIGPKEGATVVEIPPEAAEPHPSKKNAGQKAAADGEQVSESKTKRAKKGTHCATEGCGTPLPEEKRWRHCEACRLAEREKKKATQAKAVEPCPQPTADVPNVAETESSVQAFDHNVNEDSEPTSIEPTSIDPPDASNANTNTNTGPTDPQQQQQQQLQLVNMTATSFQNPDEPLPFRWTVDPAQVSSSTPVPTIDLSRAPSQQPPLMIKHYDPAGEKEATMRNTPNYQPYVTVERFPFQGVQGVGVGANVPAGENSAVGVASSVSEGSVAAATTSVTLTFSMGEDGALTGHSPYDAGVFRHYVVPSRKAAMVVAQPVVELAPSPVVGVDSGAGEGPAADSKSMPPSPSTLPPVASGSTNASPVLDAGQPVGTAEESAPPPPEEEEETPHETSTSTTEKKTTTTTNATSTTTKSKSKPKGKGKASVPAPPPTTTTTTLPPPQPSLYPYHPYYLLSPAQYAQYAAAAGAYGLVYPPVQHPSAAAATVPESVSTSGGSKAKGKKAKGKGKGEGEAASSISAPAAPQMAVHPYTYPLALNHLPYPYSALVPPPPPPGQQPVGVSGSSSALAPAPAPAFYYPPPPYHYAGAASAPPGTTATVPPPLSSLVPSYQAVSGAGGSGSGSGSVSAPPGGGASGIAGAATTSVSAPPQPVAAPQKPRQTKKQKEPKAVFNYYHHGYGTTDSPELPVGAEPGKRKRRKIDPAWLEKMRLRAEEEKRAAAGGGDATGSASAGPGASVDPSGSASACAVVTSIPSTAHVSIDADVEPVSAISSAHESEAEVEQSPDHAQEQQQSSGMLEHMDEDDPHVDDTRAPTELLPSSSRSRPSERDNEHGSPDANAQSKPCYNKTCRRRVVSTSTTGGSTFCEKCKAKLKKHAEKSKRRHNLVPVKLVPATSVGVGVQDSGGR